MPKTLIKTIFVLFILSGCSSPIEGLYPPSDQSNVRTVYVVSHGWHTGIVIKTNDIPKNIITEKTDFPKSKFIEIGWGDKGFYQNPKITIPIALRAIFLPTKSVMHLVGFSQTPEKEFPNSEIIELKLSKDGFNKMLNKINYTFDRNGKNKASKLTKGLYGNSYFYSAKGSYHVLKTCNNWTAKMIRSSGFPISTMYTSTAGNVIDQLYMKGKVIRMFKREKISPHRRKK